MADQSTDLSASQQPEGTTRVENGIAYDISGKPLGPANVADEQEKPAALAPPPGFKPLLPPPPGFKPAQAALQPPPGFKPATTEKPGFLERGAQGLGIPTSVEELKGAALGLVAQGITPVLAGGVSIPRNISEYAHKTIDDLANAWKEQKEAMQNVSEGGPLLANAGKGLEPIIKAGVRQVPFIGDPIYTAGKDWFEKNYSGALGGLTAVIAQVAIPEILERTSLGGRLRAALEDHKSATTQLASRTTEHTVAMDQARQAGAEAELARKGEAEGTVTPQQRIQAEEKASAAQANASKAQKAVAAAREEHAKASVQVEQLARTAAEKQARAENKAKGLGTPEEIEKSHKDFENAIPPGPGKSNYTRKDLTNVRPILEEGHAKTPVDSPEAVVNALEDNRIARDSKVLAAVDKYKNEPLKVTDDKGNQISIKAKLIDALAEDEKVRPGFTEEALKELDRFNTTDMSVGEGDALRKTLNSETRDKLNTAGGWRSVADARDTDPAFAAIYELQDILRDGVYGVLKDKGVKGAEDSRQLDASVIRVKNAALRQLRKPETTMRGTGEAGPIRRAGAWVARKAGIAGGAAAGASTTLPGATEVGAVTGGMLGEKVGKILNPGDLSRSQQIERSMNVKHGGKIPEISMAGSLPSNPPAIELPPNVQPPVNPRENTELHAALAAHYDESIGDTPYNELEQRLLSDIALKKKYNVPVDPAEKKLNLEINKSRVEEIQRARGQHEQQIKAAETAAKEAEAAKQEKAAAGLVTAQHPPFETTEHLPVPARYAEMGYTPQRVGVHELAHQIMVDEYGHGTGDIINHHHDMIDSGSLAEARWEKPNFMDEDGKVKPEKIPEILAILHAGVVGEELIHNIPLHENPADDLDIARKIVKDAGFSPAESGMIMKAAEMKAREVLTAPGVTDIMKRYTEHRQAGLEKDTHMSAETVGQAVQEVRHARGKGGSDEANQQARVGKEDKAGASGDESRGEGKPAGKSKEAVRPTGETGASAGEPGKGGPRTNIKSYTGTERRYREESGGVGVAERLTQGGHAGGGVASEEELARPGRFVKISRSGIPTDQGKVPDFNLAAGEAGYQVRPGGGYELKAGQETPATKRGVEGYAREVFPKTNIKVPPERTTGNPEHDAAIREGGGIPGGLMGHPDNPNHVKMFHDPQSGTTLGFAANEPVTAEATRRKLAESRAEYAAGEARKAERGAQTGVVRVEKAADDFNKANGRPAVNTKTAPHNPEFSKRVADAYDEMKHNPNDPKVKAAYDAMKNDVDKQWDYATKKMGIKFEPWTKEGQPYANSKEMVKDVKDNNHLYFFQGGESPADNPLQVIDPKTGLSYNDKFRAVHDLFGHAAQGNQFGPKGEEAAYQLHRQMFSPEAVPALTTETRGQNSWVNFGKHLRDEAGNIPGKGEKGFVPATERPYAEQKTGLLPEEFHAAEPGGIKTNLKPKEGWAEDTAEKIKKESAGGVNPENPEAESKRYGFEIIPEHRKALNAVPTAEDLKNFAQEHGEHLAAHPDIKLGWDTGGEKPELNVGATTNDLAKAKEIAGKLDQRAIWDNEKKEEIPVGGEGKRTQFPEYPIEKRIADLGPAKTPFAGTHYSPIERQTLLGADRGASLAGEEAARLQHDNKVPGVYVYREGTTPEPQIGSRQFKYNVGGDKAIADIGENGAQRPIFDKAYQDFLAKYKAAGDNDTIAHQKAMNDGEAAIRAAGYDGYDSDRMKGSTFLFGDQPIKPSEIKTNLRPKGSSVPLMQNPLPVKGTMEGGEVGVLDVTKALNQFTRKQLPALESGEAESKEMVARAKKIAEDEAKYQLAQSKTGTEWYTTEMKDHDKVLQDLRPELGQGETTDGTDGHPVNLTLFKAAEAILSSGQKPYANVKSAIKLWDLFRDTGEFPRSNPDTGKSWGPRNVNAYGGAFDSLNKLIAEKGRKGAADWLLSEHPVKELRSYQAPGQVPVKGKATDMETGAMVLGAKRGPFMQNLHGIESKFTADMWVSRTWNRWMGTLDLDPHIQENSGKMTSESDAPRNNTERSLMKESFQKTADKLGLTTSSLQAVLWYYEQALYRAHGLPVESWSFSDAAKRVAKEAKSVPEAEQTKFNFGENEGNTEERGGIAALARRNANPKFDALGRPFGRPDLNPK